MRKQIPFLLIGLFTILGMHVMPGLSYAQISPGDTGLHDTGEEIYGELSGDSESLGTFIGTRVLTPAFGLLGIVFLVLMIYAGFLWMTAAGDPGKVTKAKSLMGNAIIGLIVILLAYGFTQFIYEAIS